MKHVTVAMILTLVLVSFTPRGFAQPTPEMHEATLVKTQTPVIADEKLATAQAEQALLRFLEESRQLSEAEAKQAHLRAQAFGEMKRNVLTPQPVPTLELTPATKVEGPTTQSWGEWFSSTWEAYKPSKWFAGNEQK